MAGCVIGSDAPRALSPRMAQLGTSRTMPAVEERKPGAWCQSRAAQQTDQPDSPSAGLLSSEIIARRLSSALGCLAEWLYHGSRREGRGRSAWSVVWPVDNAALVALKAFCQLKKSRCEVSIKGSPTSDCTGLAIGWLVIIKIVARR
jgi:hypothetical protein